MSYSGTLPSTDGRKFVHRITKTIMKSHRVRLPKHDLPIRLRPWFLVFTCMIMVVLAFLGFTNLSRYVPLDRKLLHFLCFCMATSVFYFIIDIEEDARRIWFWRHSGVIFTTTICFFFGGICSEIVHSLLPYKEFQLGNVVANLLGSSLGLSLAFYLERYYRRRREIARLYRPLDPGSFSDYEDDDDEASATQLLPTNTHNAASTPKRNGTKSIRLADVWDEREEFFGIGADSDEELPKDFQKSSDLQVPKISVTRS